jgi:PAS domain S-box-containing protein
VTADYSMDYEQHYGRALANYLAGVEEEEVALLRAYELGRQSITHKRSILDLIGIHYQAVRAVMVMQGGAAATELGVKKAEAFLTQAVTPFEMSHRQAQQQTQTLRDSERRKGAILDSAFDAIITMNHAGRIVEFNPAAEHMFGHPRGKALGADLAELIVPPRLRQSHRHALAHYLVTGEGPILGQRLELPGLRADGSEFPAEVAVNAMRIDEQPFFTAYVRDITERKRAEAQAQQFNAELERRVTERTAELMEVNRELDSFTYSVSHDLRAPLRAIDGFSRILIDKYVAGLPPEAARYLGLVRSNTQQMGHLVNDLLALSRLGRTPITKTEVDLGELVGECLETLRPETEGRSVELDIGELGICNADRDLLRQVFMNLLGNALKYSRRRQPAHVEVRTERRDGECVVWVRDNGVGFDMRYADKLFGVFQRLHRAEDYEGTGVGLAIVQRIVQRHGGRVWVEAALDQGATFFVALPLDEPGDSAQQHDASLPQEGTL